MSPVNYFNKRLLLPGSEDSQLKRPRLDETSQVSDAMEVDEKDLRIQNLEKQIQTLQRDLAAARVPRAPDFFEYFAGLKTTFLEAVKNKSPDLANILNLLQREGFLESYVDFAFDNLKLDNEQKNHFWGLLFPFFEAGTLEKESFPVFERIPTVATLEVYQGLQKEFPEDMLIQPTLTINYSGEKIYLVPMQIKAQIPVLGLGSLTKFFELPSLLAECFQDFYEVLLGHAQMDRLSPAQLFIFHLIAKKLEYTPLKKACLERLLSLEKKHVFSIASTVSTAYMGTPFFDKFYQVSGPLVFTEQQWKCIPEGCINWDKYVLAKFENASGVILLSRKHLKLHASYVTDDFSQEKEVIISLPKDSITHYFYFFSITNTEIEIETDLSLTVHLAGMALYHAHHELFLFCVDRIHKLTANVSLKSYVDFLVKIPVDLISTDNPFREKLINKFWGLLIWETDIINTEYSLNQLGEEFKKAIKISNFNHIGYRGNVSTWPTEKIMMCSSHFGKYAEEIKFEEVNPSITSSLHYFTNVKKLTLDKFYLNNVNLSILRSCLPKLEKLEIDVCYYDNDDLHETLPLNEVKISWILDKEGGVVSNLPLNAFKAPSSIALPAYTFISVFESLSEEQASKVALLEIHPDVGVLLDLALLSKCRNLKEIIIPEYVTGEGLVEIMNPSQVKLSSVRKLSVAFQMESYEFLKAFPNLSELKIACETFPEVVSELVNLQEIDLQELEDREDSSLSSISFDFSKLEYLKEVSLHTRDGFEKRDVLSLLKISSLERIKLRCDDFIPANVVEALLKKEGLKSLTCSVDPFGVDMRGLLDYAREHGVELTLLAGA